MRAMRVTDFEQPPVVQDTDDAGGTSDPGWVTVGVEYAGVNPLDLRVARGLAGRPALPLTLGCEGSGRTADGTLVLVYGHGIGVVRDGTYAEKVRVPSGAVVPVPPGADPVQVAGVGVAGVTAYEVVHRVARVQAGDVVLVLAAAGGVGSVAVQLAGRAGARVLAQTSSPDKAEWLETLGAEPVVADAAALRGQLRGTKPTVVLDALGGEFSNAAAASLRTGGRHVVFGASAGRTGPLDFLGVYRKGLRIEGYGSGLQDTTEAATACLALIATGDLAIPVDEVFPLADAAAAHRRLADRSVRGKVVLDCRPR
jgi:NADPH2:quinone reductase